MTIEDLLIVLSQQYQFSTSTCMMWHSTCKSILLTRHNQEITQLSSGPFPNERVGSGHETNKERACDIVQGVMGGKVHRLPRVHADVWKQNATDCLVHAGQQRQRSIPL